MEKYSLRRKFDQTSEWLYRNTDDFRMFTKSVYTIAMTYESLCKAGFFLHIHRLQYSFLVPF